MTHTSHSNKSRKLVYKVTVEAYWKETVKPNEFVGSLSKELSVVTPLIQSNLSIWVTTAMHKLTTKAKEKLDE